MPNDLIVTLLCLISSNMYLAKTVLVKECVLISGLCEGLGGVLLLNSGCIQLKLRMLNKGLDRHHEWIGVTWVK